MTDLTFVDIVEAAEASDRCSHCKRQRPDRVGLSLLETDDLEAEDFGFCSIPCLAVFIRSRYIETAA